MREMLAQHRANPVCASCHARFDVFGLAFEGYGPVGEARTKDLAGRPVDASAVFPGGSEGAGFEGVQDYIREHRQDDFVDNLSRKLLAYALNRSLQLSDELADRAHASRAGRQWLPLRFAGRDHRHQPAIPEPAQSRICAKNAGSELTTER